MADFFAQRRQTWYSGACFEELEYPMQVSDTISQHTPRMEQAMKNPKDAVENIGGAAIRSPGNNKDETHSSAHDLDWKARIARAKEAKMEGKKAREGKPITFRMTRKLKIK